jgi:hypothetical protein
MVFMYSQHLREEKSQEEATVYAKRVEAGWTKEEVIDIMLNLDATNEFIYRNIRGDRTKLWKYLADRRATLAEPTDGSTEP